MAKQYDHKQIESKWQKLWEDSQAFKVSNERSPDVSVGVPTKASGKKLYILDMFPYPSGAGLHVGHVEGYTATDIYSRYKRMQGHDVLHPMGWDAFGLPAENYAVKTGIPPVKTTSDSIDTFRKQIKSLGLSYDWSREIGTHTPEYYKWTQWLFLLLYKNGLAEKKLSKVNWCPKDQTVLANEQVVNGACERCGTPVVQKDLEQWFFKITDYADALVDDLDQIDWPESTKVNQRNWIGRSEGAEIEFDISNSKEKIKVFTTRPDTLFGATYMVLAPEHALVQTLAEKAENKTEVLAYVEAAKNKTDLERQEGQKDKTGVELKGIKAINPANKEEIPVFIADYVLGSYGTGAIMAVPAHDERDMEFAKKFNLPIRTVIIPDKIDANNPPRGGKKTVARRSVYGIVRRQSDGRYLLLRWKHSNWLTFVIGGVEENENLIDAAIREIREETGYQHLKFIKELGDAYANYFAAHKDENRRAHSTGLLFELTGDESEVISEEEKKKHEPVWLTFEEARAQVIGVEPPIFLPRIEKEDWTYSEDGTLFNSGEFSGLKNEEAKKKIIEAVGGKITKTYRLRDWLISRQRYWGAPIPVVYDPEGKPHPVPEEHLPWLLPTDVEFKPTGTSPLGASKELLERTEKLFGKGWKPEVDTMDTFMCSSWYFFRFADSHNDKEFASKEAMEKWLPVDLYVGGAEHTVLHLMYARFFTKVLKKLGYITFDEPFTKLRHQGTILAEDGTKMSKSKGNVINPDDVIERYGADTLRLYEMFMGPFEAMKPWNTQNILGVRRFLERVWRLEIGENTLNAKTETLLNQTIKKVTDDLDSLKFNTALSSLMILLNEFEAGKKASKVAYATFLQLLAPFAPHMVAELAEGQGVALQGWPTYDQTKLTSATVPVAVQVNGKLRATLELPADMGEGEALEAARADTNVQKWLALGKEERAVYVPGKVINFVVRQV